MDPKYLVALALVGAVGLPIVLALAPPVARAVGATPSTALMASVMLTIAAVAAFLWSLARDRSGAGVDARARNLFAAAGVAAIMVLALFPVQMSVFALAWPPPTSAEAYFELLDADPIVGLLSLDILLMADWLILLVVWAGLYVALRRSARITMAVALGGALVATVMYFASNTAFELLRLSQEYAAATGPERASLLAQGESALARFEGPWFVVSYLLSGVSVLLASLAMWRSPSFGRPVGGIGIAYGALQLVPPTLGAVGMLVSVVSLLPMVAWLALVARSFFRLAMGRSARARRASVAM